MEARLWNRRRALDMGKGVKWQVVEIVCIINEAGWHRSRRLHVNLKERAYGIGFLQSLKKWLMLVAWHWILFTPLEVSSPLSMTSGTNMTGHGK